MPKGKKKQDEKPQIGPKPRADAQVGHPSKPLQWKLLADAKLGKTKTGTADARIKPPTKSKRARIGKRNK